MMRRFLIFLCAIGAAASLIGQDESDVLFKVEGIAVTEDEFRYIYEKNNRDGADYSRQSLEEYLDLYGRFKLKVKKARDLQLDTISTLQRELDGYRRQLAKTYLNDKEVVEKLTREAYERMQKDVRVAHILARAMPNAGEQRHELSREKIEEAYKSLEAGEAFGDVVMRLSEDRTTKSNGGDLGYLTAMLPNGFYAMENAIYTMEEGEYSEPIQTTLGYHIVKVIDSRPGRGKVEISHILARVNENGSNANSAKSKIDGIYENLKSGIDFEELARSVSDDTKTAKRGGYIGKVGINEYDPEFEAAAFALENPGDISEPVRSRVGWHIIKLIKKVPLKSYEEEKRILEASMTGNERMDIAREALIERIKESSGFEIDSLELNTFALQLTDEFKTFKWQPNKVRDVDVITFEDGTSKSLADFAEYARVRARVRMRSPEEASPADLAYQLFDEFADEACLAYEESHLAEKYPEFTALMREYEEGILLFEVTKRKVWDQASEDTTGLNEFYEENKSNYMWPQRARVATYRINSTDKAVTMKGYKLAGPMEPDAWLEEMNKGDEIATVKIDLKDKEAVEAAGLEWNEGFSTSLLHDPNLGGSFTRIISIEEPVVKELNEAKGYVIADYQDHLEKLWVKELEEEYEMLVNEQLFESMIDQQQ